MSPHLRKQACSQTLRSQTGMLVEVYWRSWVTLPNWKYYFLPRLSERFGACSKVPSFFIILLSRPGVVTAPTPQSRHALEVPLLQPPPPQTSHPPTPPPPKPPPPPCDWRLDLTSYNLFLCFLRSLPKAFSPSRNRLDPSPRQVFRF